MTATAQEPEPAVPVGKPPSPSTARAGSIDAYRGLVMLLMMGEVLEFSRVSKALPENGFWAFLAHHQSHAEWVGYSLHDLIQPSFSFLVGVALPFSLSKRAIEGQPSSRRTLHAFWRAFVLILLGVFLRSIYSTQTNWTFEDTLSQIGLGYGFLYLLSLHSVRAQWITFGTLLFGYWLAFAVYPLPQPGFDWGSAGVTPDDPARLTGFAAHWNKNTNLAWAIDKSFLNLFPREHPFTRNPGGYSTTSFIPTLATMILGLLAGGVLRREQCAAAKLRWLVTAALLGLAIGWVLGSLGVCPVVKRIWTPSWVLFSGGWCLLILAAFYVIIDAWNKRAWAFCLVIVGMNSIAAYLITHLFRGFIAQALPRHFGPAIFDIAGSAYQPLLHGAAVLLVEWLILLWMYKRKIFPRI